jgi:hypothetical protein
MAKQIERIELSSGARISGLDAKHKAYLGYHRHDVFATDAG